VTHSSRAVAVRFCPRRVSAWAALASLLSAAIAAAAAAPSAVGEKIYLDGRLPSGAPLVAERGAGLRVAGAPAACVNCHRRSGLGMQEGGRSIPPIAGIYLFAPRAQHGDEFDLPFVEGMRPDRDPYTEQSLARAIREGTGADGKPLNALMPRFKLTDAEMRELIAYLKSLSPGRVPGVEDTVLHFATIVTPDANPQVSQGTVDVLEKFFADKNHYTRAQGPRLHSSHRLRFKANRNWALHVWTLGGAPDTWESQLRAKLAAEPVFAVISGAGGPDWAPIHHFCEAEAVPCLFPNVDAPVVAERDFYDVYLSKGVLLEAQLVAHQIEALRSKGSYRRIVQVFREGDVGGTAAAELALDLRGGRGHAGEPDLVMRRLSGTDRERGLAAAIRGVHAGDVLVLWLRPEDVAALGAVPTAATVFMSGRMAGLERAPLPRQWRRVTRLAWPYDLPSHSRVQMDYPLGWFRIRKVPVVAEQAQADTYLACIILSDTINHMSDTFVRPYLVERIEQGLEHRVLTIAYPRLSLGPGQKFASKGGYIVHFADEAGTRLVADSGWIVP
jgi:mono/diheme cytochrome c family protein